MCKQLNLHCNHLDQAHVISHLGYFNSLLLIFCCLSQPFLCKHCFSSHSSRWSFKNLHVMLKTLQKLSVALRTNPNSLEQPRMLWYELASAFQHQWPLTWLLTWAFWLAFPCQESFYWTSSEVCFFVFKSELKCLPLGDRATSYIMHLSCSLYTYTKAPCSSLLLKTRTGAATDQGKSCLLILHKQALLFRLCHLGQHIPRKETFSNLHKSS